MEEMRFLSEAHMRGISMEEMKILASDMFKNLPSDQYPNIVRLSSYMVNTDKDDEFKFGLQILLEGMVKRL